MSAIAADLTSFLTWAIILTMIAALALGGLIGWVRCSTWKRMTKARERAEADDYTGDQL